MAGAHVRCSESVHRKLKQISAQEGVPLSQALEILTSTLGPDDIPTRQVVKDTDPLDYFMESVEPPDVLTPQQVEDHFTRVQDIVTKAQETMNERMEEALNKAQEDRRDALMDQPCDACGDTMEMICGNCAQAERAHAEDAAYRQGVAHTKDVYEDIPGVTENREKWELGQQMVTVTNGKGPQRLSDTQIGTGSRILEDGSTRKVSIDAVSQFLAEKSSEYSQRVQFTKGSMAGTEGYFRQRDLIPI